jgi:hypothetical protein
VKVGERRMTRYGGRRKDFPVDNLLAMFTVE